MFRTCHRLTQFLFILLVNLGALNLHQGLAVGCHEAEREVLVMFKESLISPTNGLSSWEGKSCCDWEGVGCDNVTAFVNRLDLHNPYYYQPFDDNTELSYLIALPLDPSLIELRHLKYLDLSGNDFLRSQIPEFIGSFKYLRYLNLSYSNFVGIVPPHLGNLTRLQTLDLSSFDEKGYLSSDLHWVSKLVSLQYLNFGGGHISHTNSSMHSLNMPPSLRVLHLNQCQNLDNSLLLRLISNSTCLSRIQHLDLSRNKLKGSIPLSMRNMRKLEYLDLSSNSFSRVEGGTIMGILGNLCRLITIDLSHNSIGGSIEANPKNVSRCVTYDLENLNLSGNMIKDVLPSWLGNFKYLSVINISGSRINGPIPVSIGRLLYLEKLDLSHNTLIGTIPQSLEQCKSLVHIDLSYNSLNGILPQSLEQCKSLVHIDLSFNSLNGILPQSLEQCKSLVHIDLSFNSLNGILPQSLGQCKSLVHIDLSSNFLHGALSESHLDNLSRLEYLDLSYNVVEWNISSNWSPPFQLRELHMASCKIQSQFPRWIGDQTKLITLDFSANNMSGELPQCFSSNRLTDIHLSYNRITGPVPYFSSTKLEFIDLSFNFLSGSLVHHNPSAKNDIVGTPICQLYRLELLDLQMNNISGSIPDCWNGSDFLGYINLASNKLSGIIPLSIGLLSVLEFLKLSENSLHGPIPPTLSTSSYLQILDLGENKLDGNIPSNWGGQTLPDLQVLRLRGNQLVGVIPSTLCSLPTLHFIDLSHNNLTGSIPLCFGHLLLMKSSNVNGLGFFLFYHQFPLEAKYDSTKVVLKGVELQYTSTLKYVVNLDLSCNALTGSIPEEITNLLALIGLNLSHNHLTGNIPNNIGEMTSLESLDLSNNILSGTIPASISALTSLVCLNLSYNKLQGQIPTGHQLQVIEDPSTTYIGNPKLCGDPLPNKCRTNHGENQSIQEQEKSDKVDIWEKPLLYLVIMSGFATGFWGVVGSLLLKRRFRFALFQLVGNVADYLYVQVMIRLNRFRSY